MKLRKLLREMCEGLDADKLGIYVFWRREQCEEREYRLYYSNTYKAIIVEYRYYPDKHGCWSSWSPHNGFSVQDVLAEDWL